MEFREQLRTSFREEQGVEVIELVFVLVVPVGLVIIFKKQTTTSLENTFKEVNSQSKEVY